MVTREMARDKLAQLMKQHSSEVGNLDLLLFFLRHPHAQFSRLAIVHALGTEKLDARRTLERLRENGLIKSFTKNGIYFYSLNQDQIRV